MRTANIFDAKTNLSKYIRELEDKNEDVIFIARNGRIVAQLTLATRKDAKQRIGVLKGKTKFPDNFDEVFDSLDNEIADEFGGDKDE